MSAERADQIGGFRFNGKVDEASEDFYLVSHPGYCLFDGGYQDVGLGLRDHAGYSQDFFDEFAR